MFFQYTGEIRNGEWGKEKREKRMEKIDIN